MEKYRGEFIPKVEKWEREDEFHGGFFLFLLLVFLLSAAEMRSFAFMGNTGLVKTI